MQKVACVWRQSGLSTRTSDEKSEGYASGEEVGPTGCTDALTPIMSEQRSPGGYACGREVVRLCNRARRLSGVTQGGRSFSVCSPSMVPYVDEGCDLHGLLIPVPPPIGELLRDSGFLAGEHVREHRGIRLR